MRGYTLAVIPGGAPGVAPAEILLVAVRWAHAMAAVAWVGGSVFLLWVLEPALGVLGEGDRSKAARAVAARGFRELADAAIVVFIVSGAILTFDRLSSPAASPAYVAILGAKVALAVVTFILATRLRRADRARRLPLARWQVGLGAAIILLAALLKTLYEGGLAR
jgi:uncharacterized membrane protein